MTMAKAQKIMEQVAEGKGHLFPPEEVKAAMSMLMQAVIESHEAEAKARAARAELPCPWRLSDDLQKIRLTLPEPSHVDFPVAYYRLPEDNKMDFQTWTESFSDMTPAKIRTMGAQLFVSEGGARFLAWTADGKNPLFPIPL